MNPSPRPTGTPRPGSALALAACLAAATTSCNGGIAALVSATQDDPNQTASTLGGFAVTETRVSPATIRLVAQDSEGDDVTLRLWYTLPGQPARALVGLASGNPLTAATSSGGVQHELVWDFALEQGLDPATYTEGVAVYAVPAGASVGELIDGQNAALGVAFGNDAPIASGAVLPSSEASGIALLQFTLEDSASDLVDVTVEYDVLGDVPDAGWRLTRPASLMHTPPISMPQLATSPAGSLVSYFWDTLADLPNGDAPVSLRVTPRDAYAVGASLVTDQFPVDNNTPPNVLFSELALSESTDRFRGVAVGGQVFDEEGDRVRLVAQYRRANEPFPTLPGEVPALLAALADPTQRALLQICTPVPFHANGELDPAGPSSVRIRDFHQRLGTLPSSSYPEAVLEILRPTYGFHDVAHAWPGGGPSSATDAAVTRDGLGLVVLETTGGAGWRLTRYDLTVVGGTPTPTVLATGSGAPVALSRFVDTWLVAADHGLSWELTSLDAMGAVLATATGSGVLRDMTAENARMAFATVDDAVVRIGLTDTGTEVAVLVQNLVEPWGVAHAPFVHGRLVVAEHGRDRLLEVDVAGRYARELVATGPGGMLAFPAPRDVAVLQGETQIAAVCEPAPGTGELRVRAVGRALPDGSGGYAPLVDVWTTCGPGSRVAHGGGGVSTLTAGVVRIAGGVEQRVGVLQAEPAGETLLLAAPLSPAVSGPRQFRLTAPDPGRLAPPSGAFSRTVWDTAAEQSAALPWVMDEDVFLRLTPYDADLGFPSEGIFPIQLDDAGGHQDAPLLGTGTPALADLDRDGDLDVLLNDGDASTVVHQNTAGQFVQSTQTVALSAGGPPLSGAGGGAITWLGFGQALAIDADEDGIVDLVTAGPAGLQLAFGQPAGELEARAAVMPPPADVGVALRATAADLDGDGSLEFVTAHSVCGSGLGRAVVLWRRSGARAWTADPPLRLDNPESFFNDGTPTLIEPMDIDSDGDLDLVVAAALSLCDNSGALLWYPQVAPLEFEPTIRLLHDFQQPVETNGEFVSLHVADLDEDGREDLLVTSSLISLGPVPGLGKSSLQRRTGATQFEWEAERFGTEKSGLSTFLSTVRGAALVRLDGDERADLVVLHNLRYPTSLRDGSSALGGTATTSAPITVGAYNQEERFPAAVGDVDADGVVDFLYSGLMEQPGSIGFAGPVQRVTAGRSRLRFGALAEGAPTGVTTFWANVGWTVADLDQDGDLDLVSLSPGEGGVFGPGGTVVGRNAEVTLFEQTEPRRFAERQTVVTIPAARACDALVEDLDGDGSVELAVLSWNGSFTWPWYLPPTGGSIYIYRRLAGIQFDGASPLVLASTGLPLALDAVDLDGDGDLDLAVALNRGVAVWIQDAPGVFREVVVAAGIGVPPSGSPNLLGLSTTAKIEAVDVDGDGLVDLVSTQYSNDHAVPSTTLPPLTVYFQTAPETFAITPIGATGGTRAWDHVTTDVDGDGRRDIVWVDRSGQRVHVLQQTAPRQFVAREPLLVSPVPTNPLFPGGGGSPSAGNLFRGLHLSDFDEDGDLDAILHANVLGTQVLVQTAPGRFVHHARFAAQGFSGSNPDAADLDGDGQLDLLGTTKVLWGGTE